MLLGRQHECDVLDRMLGAARRRHGGGIVVLGDPGIGKTALIEYAIETAEGFQVLRTIGIEAERELPFAALHQVAAPCLASLEHLPEPQRDALRVAFGLDVGVAPDRLLVGLAVLNLLSHFAEEQPLLCLVDDAQWLDRASARVFAFVARRLLAERIAMVFAAREVGRALAGFPEVRVEPL